MSWPLTIGVVVSCAAIMEAGVDYGDELGLAVVATDQLARAGLANLIVELPGLRVLGEYLHLRLGHSGGPVVDAAGSLVGLNARMAVPEVGLATPSHVISSFLKRSFLDRESAKPLGIRDQDLTLALGN